MKLTNKKIIKYTIVGVLFIAAMTAATLFDFKISSAFTKLKDDTLSITVSSFSVVMEIVGEWPALIFGSFCGAIIIRALNKAKITKAYISSAFIVLVIFGLMFYGSISTAKHISGEISAAAIPICIAVSAILTAITIFAVMKQSGQFETKLLRIEFDGFVEILRRHTGMLQIGSEFRHCFRHKITS